MNEIEVKEIIKIDLKGKYALVSKYPIDAATGVDIMDVLSEWIRHSDDQHVFLVVDGTKFELVRVDE